MISEKLQQDTVETYLYCWQGPPLLSASHSGSQTITSHLPTWTKETGR